MREYDTPPPLDPVEKNFNERLFKVGHVAWQTAKYAAIGAVVIGLGLTGFAIYAGASALGPIAALAGAGAMGIGSALLGAGTGIAALGAGSVLAPWLVGGAAIIGTIAAVAAPFLISSGISSAVGMAGAALASILITGTAVGGIAGGILGAVMGISKADEAAQDKLDELREKNTMGWAREERRARTAMAREQQYMAMKQQAQQLGFGMGMEPALPMLSSNMGRNTEALKMGRSGV